jgi:hypothetical protein
MRACCPDQVDDHNPVSSVELFCRRPRLGHFSLATTVAGVTG